MIDFAIGRAEKKSSYSGAFAKRIIICLSVLIMLAVLPLSLASCAADNSIDTEKYEYDKYGYVRPKNVWISESVILPGILPQSELFGTLGESGILSDYVLGNKGKVNPGETNYFVTMCYGNPGTEYLNTYLRFVLVNDDGIFFDEECVNIGKPLKYGIDIESFDMSAPPGSRLLLRCGGEKIQGAIVIPFTLKEGMEGILSAHCVAESPNDTVLHDVRGEAEARIGNIAGETSVAIDDISVRYMSESSYKAGDFSDAAMSDEPIFKDGELCYMLLDVYFTPLKDNGGDMSIGCCTVLHSDQGDSLTVESASTAQIEEALKDGAYSVRTLYGVPKVAGEQKKASVMLRLNAEAALKKQMEIFIYSAEGMPLSGATLLRDVFGATEFLDEPILPDAGDELVSESFMPWWVITLISVGAALLVLTSCFILKKKNDFVSRYEYIPLISLVIVSAGAVAQLLLLTKLDWWIISISSAAVIAAMTVCVSNYYRYRENLSIVILCITAPAVSFIAAIQVWQLWEVAVAALACIAVFIPVGCVAHAVIEKHIGEPRFIFISTLLSAAVIVPLILLSPLVWWQVAAAGALSALLIAMLAVIIGSRT